MNIVPYLIFDGNCEEALNHYSAAFNGSAANMQRYGDAPQGEGPNKMDADKVMHAQFHAGDLFFMVSDGPIPGGKGGNVQLSVDFKDTDEQTRVFDALSAGGEVKMPLQDTFWGARFGMLTDKFGIHWMFNYDKPKN